MWSHHMILLVINQRHYTKFTFAYYLIITYLIIDQFSFIYYETRINLAAHLGIAKYWSYNGYEIV